MSIAHHNGRESKIFGDIMRRWKLPFPGPFLKGDFPFISLFLLMYMYKQILLKMEEKEN